MSFSLVGKWLFHVSNYLNNINKLEFREPLEDLGRSGDREI